MTVSCHRCYFPGCVQLSGCNFSQLPGPVDAEPGIRDCLPHTMVSTPKVHSEHRADAMCRSAGGCRAPSGNVLQMPKTVH